MGAGTSTTCVFPDRRYWRTCFIRGVDTNRPPIAAPGAATSGYARLVAKENWNGSKDEGWHLFLQANTAELRFARHGSAAGEDTYVGYAATALAIGAWQHVVCAYDGTMTALQASPVGLGWTLDFGAVFRSGKKDANGNWLFSLVHNGRTFELARVDDTHYRTRPDEYLRVRRLTDGSNVSPLHEYWLVESTDGTTYRFGFLENSEMLAGRYQFSPDGSQQLAWQWNLDRIRDRHGNTIELTYQKVTVPPIANPVDTTPYDQAAYPSSIRYGGNDAASPTVAHNRTITFTYVERTDWATNANFTYTQYCLKQKLDRIEMAVGGTLVRKYLFGTAYQRPLWHLQDDGTPPSPDRVQGLDKLMLVSLAEESAGGSRLPATTFTYHEGAVPGGTELLKLQLAEIQNGYGAKLRYHYEGHTPDGWWKLRRRYRIKEHRLETGLGPAAGVQSQVGLTYGYGTSYNVASSYEYRGHGDVTVTDTEGHDAKTLFYTRDAQNGKTADEVAVLQSRPYVAERWKAGATTFTTREETSWLVRDTQAGARFIAPEEVRQYQGEANRKTRFEYDAYGNRTGVKEYDYAAAVVSGWVRSRRSELFPVDTATAYVVDRVAREVLFQPSASNPVGDWVRVTQYCYDGSYRYDNPVGSTLYGGDGSARGRLTAVRRVLDDARCVDVTYDYDAFGNRTATAAYGGYGTTNGPLATADPRRTSVAYETAYHTFPETIENVLGHRETRTYDARWGVLTSSRGPNGQDPADTQGAYRAAYDFDAFGRLTQVMGPQVDGPGGAYRATTVYAYGEPTTSAAGRTTTALETRVRTDAGGTPAWRSSWQFYDGIGRVAQTYAPADDAGNVTVANTYYDGRGLAWRTTVAHTASGSGAFLESDWASFSGPDTRTQYDELRRPTLLTLPGGATTQTSYAGWAATTVDSNHHQKRSRRDALGRLVAVDEYAGTDPWTLYATTTYAYDLADQLTGVTDALRHQTRIVYDALGRKVQMADPDMGTWQYTYDAPGTLRSQTDARGQRLDFFYDALDRLVRTWYPAAWTQDTLSGGASLPTMSDLMEVRAAVDTDRVAAGLAPAAWTDPAIVPGTAIPIKAVNFTELRTRIQDLWTTAGLGSVPEFSGGTILPVLRLVKASDLPDLRTWLGQYESSPLGQTRRARVLRTYDAFDPTAGQFGRGQRTGLWDASGHATFAWDRAGQLTQETRVLDGQPYATRSAFDALGRVVQSVFPDGETLTSRYGAHGLLDQSPARSAPPSSPASPTPPSASPPASSPAAVAAPRCARPTPAWTARPRAALPSARSSPTSGSRAPARPW